MFIQTVLVQIQVVSHHKHFKIFHCTSILFISAIETDVRNNISITFSGTAVVIAVATFLCMNGYEAKLTEVEKPFKSNSIIYEPQVKSCP